MEAFVCVGGCAESAELAHGPGLAAIHGRINPARVGRLAGIAEISVVVEVANVVGVYRLFRSGLRRRL